MPRPKPVSASGNFSRTARLARIPIMKPSMKMVSMNSRLNSDSTADTRGSQVPISMISKSTSAAGMT